MSVDPLDNNDVIHQFASAFRHDVKTLDEDESKDEEPHQRGARRCFWARWDASPNQKLIHEIIEVYEEGLARGKKIGKSKKERRNKKGCSSSVAFHTVATVHENMNCAPQRAEQKNIGVEGEIGIGSSQKGSVRKIVSFVGERIWGVWGV
ncbi:uncharacterized protein LOC143581284 [Bidens hawaiensis]|uniref:uncharacterized protein LOC143581284 n=1 Tax=Bidens hawaiensis TaxID=980011 RepID=UPI00404ADB46